MDTGTNAPTEMLIDEGPDTPDEPRDPIDDLTSRINNKYVLLHYCIIYIFNFHSASIQDRGPMIPVIRLAQSMRNTKRSKTTECEGWLIHFTSHDDMVSFELFSNFSVSSKF